MQNGRYSIWILPRIAAGERLKAEDFTALGEGGFVFELSGVLLSRAASFWKDRQESRSIKGMRGKFSEVVKMRTGRQVRIKNLYNE